MKNIVLKGSILVYTIFVLTVTMILFIISDQTENFAENKKNDVIKSDLPFGTKYQTIEYGERFSIEEIFDITEKQMEELEVEVINFDSKKIGSTNVMVTFKKNDEISQGNVFLTIIDKDNPIITTTNSTIYTGEEFDPLTEVSAKDNVDGDLSSKIEVSGIVDTSNEGTYKVEYTVSDFSNNQTSKIREVSVIADPNATPVASNLQVVSESQNSEESNLAEVRDQQQSSEIATQANGTVTRIPLIEKDSHENQPNILVINGITIPYQNGGQGSGQSVIDSDPSGSASTWGGIPIQSGDDGLNTHFIGHNPGIFSVLFNVGLGQTISVNDTNGKTTNYYVNNILHLDDFGKDLTTGVDYWDQTIGPTGGERITLQTCISDTENLMVLASK